jgi:ATP-dependent exoDNAse (exonuclease V) alpha subunit
LIPSSQHLTDEQLRALDLIESSVGHVFLTGRAGTGKTTFLDRLRKQTSRRTVVLAPTGVAAVRAGGQTLHSFFRIKPGLIDTQSIMADMLKGEKKPWMIEDENWLAMIRELDRVVIDEISMVRADLLDMVDLTLKHHRDNPQPFGGVQMVFIGDLYQMAPVVTRLEAHAFEQLYSTAFFHGAKVVDRIRLNLVTFTKVFRQTDPEFIDLLDRVRTGTMLQEDVDWINSRYRPMTARFWDSHVHLFGRVDQVMSHNKMRLDRLEGPTWCFEAVVDGKIHLTSVPADQSVELKRGARVMILKNDRQRQLYNGQLGTVVDVLKGGVRVDLDQMGVVWIEPYTWVQIVYRWNRHLKQIEEEIVGSFTQIPLRLAWAMTIHKSQGLSLDRVALGIDQAFTSGQLYVALSRCRTWRGLRLCSPIHDRTNRVDPQIRRWLERAGTVEEPELTPETRLRCAWLAKGKGDIRRATDWYMKALEVIDPESNPIWKRFMRMHGFRCEGDAELARLLEGRLRRRAPVHELSFNLSHLA